MSHDRRGVLRSTLLRAAYVACVALVFSFILFEVLDIDGSDFPTPPSALRVTNVEPPHDLKRYAPAGPMKLALEHPVVVADTAASCRALGHVTAPGRPTPLAAGLQRSPVTLPRASLDDLPSAV